MKIKVKIIEKCSADVRLAPLVAQAHVELADNGTGPVGDISWYWSDGAVVAEDKSGKNVVGLITFRHEKGNPSCSVIVGYVAPSYRREGVYTKMWEALVEHSRSQGAARIWGCTHVTNVAMRAFYKKLGRIETHVQSEFTIPPK